MADRQENPDEEGHQMTRENTVNVPVEPSQRMIDAGSLALGAVAEGGGGPYLYSNATLAVYRAMVGCALFDATCNSALLSAPLHEGEGEDWSELERLARTAEALQTSDDWHSGAWLLRHMEQEDAAFIAAANPATILKLIASARSANEGEGEPVAWQVGTDGAVYRVKKDAADRADTQPGMETLQASECTKNGEGDR